MRPKCWFKLWLTVFDEADLMVACKTFPQLFQGWVGLLACARKCDRNGRLETAIGPMTEKEIAATCHLDPRQVRRILGWTSGRSWVVQVSTSRGLVYVVKDWDEYQETPAAARSRKYREKEASVRDSHVTSPVIVTVEAEAEAEAELEHGSSLRSDPPGSLQAVPAADAPTNDEKAKTLEKKKRVIKPPRFSLDMDTFEWVGVDDREGAKMRKLFPGVNIPTELRSAASWVAADPVRRLKVNWPKFLYGWLGRAQDRVATNNGNGGTKSAPPKRWQDDPTRDRFGREYSSVALAREIEAKEAMEAGHG